jgi:hypothetical protein
VALVETKGKEEMSDSEFTLKGRVKSVESKATQAGKTFKVVRVEFDVLTKFPSVCDIKLFGNAAGEDIKSGDFVEVKGKLGGRLWNDKVYNDLVAFNVQVVANHAETRFETQKNEGDEVPF